MLALQKVDELIAFIDDAAIKIQSLRIDAICTYPIKSCGPIIMDKKNESFPFTKQGLKYDRKWVVINAKTRKKMTQREYRKLALIKPSLTESDLIINIDNKICKISLNADFGDDGDCGDQVAKLLSDFIEIECRLIKNVTSVQSWDSHPLLIVFQESIIALNQKILNKNEIKYNYLRFRPNLLLSGMNAFDEESVKFITFNNESKFICDRNLWYDGCLNVTCIDYKNATFDNKTEPKNTLKQWKDALFGLGLRAPIGKENGILTVGDKAMLIW